MSVRRILPAGLLAIAVTLSAYATETATHSPPVVATGAEWTRHCTKWDKWDKPGPPYRIHGDTYYVGTCGIAAILIVGDDGHILIDSGTKAGAGIVKRNVQALGFSLRDIGLLLSSHEHFDHVGGMAKLQQSTGARVMTSKAAASVMASGKDAPGDPQFGMHPPMAPVHVDGTVSDGETLALGNLRITAIATPGHTPGALSWQWESCEADQCRMLVYADSLSPVSGKAYRFGDHPDYVAAYRAGLERLATAQCDILLTPHPSSSGMVERLSSDTGLENSSACASYARSIGVRLDKRLARERAENDGR